MQLANKYSVHEAVRICLEEALVSRPWNLKRFFPLQEQAERAEATSQQDERYNAIEEKFRKMKDLYSKIREEHVGLLRSVSSLELFFAESYF